MKVVTRKTKVQAILSDISVKGEEKEIIRLVSNIYSLLLTQNVRFPLLEFAAKEILLWLPEKKQIAFTDAIIKYETIGGNVIAGIVLQLRLDKHFNESIAKAAEYILFGNEWYVCDIIAERVFGFALLTNPEKTISVLRKFTTHSNKWMVRSVGVATHYAVKKGLKKLYTDQMFQILLSLSHATDFHTKKGIGWAAKTIAKFHPDIITNHRNAIEMNESVRPWFKTKIKIGLSRSYKYASKYPD